MFRFEDLIRLSPATSQSNQGSGSDDLIIALKNASTELKNQFLRLCPSEQSKPSRNN